MARSIKSTSATGLTSLPTGLDSRLQSVLRANQLNRRRSPAALSTPPGRRIRNAARFQATHEPSSRNHPPAPQWHNFEGGGGLFRGTLRFPLKRGASSIHDVLLEVQIASDSAFTTNLTSYSVGPSFSIFFPNITRYARARARLSDSGWSPWAVFGSPTAVSSGVIALSAVESGTPTGTGPTAPPEPEPPPQDIGDSPSEDPLVPPTGGGGVGGGGNGIPI